jgi:hypothetical protein
LERALLGHETDGTALAPLRLDDPKKNPTHFGVGSGGAMLSSANDMLTFAEAIYGRKHDALNRAADAYVGLHIDSETFPAPTQLRHSGGPANGYVSDFAADWDTKSGMYMLSNTNNSSVVPASDKLFEDSPWVAQEPAPTPVPVVAPLQARAKKWAGLYRQNDGNDFWYLGYDAGVLRLTAPWTWQWGKMEMNAVSASDFKVKGWGPNLNYHFNSSGKAVTMKGTEPGKPDSDYTRVAALSTRDGAKAQDVCGVWKGQVRIAGKDQEMLFKIEEVSEGALMVRFQEGGYFGYKVDGVTFDRGVLDFEASTSAGMFLGELQEDSKVMKGYWCQSEVSPVTLKKIPEPKGATWFVFKGPEGK